MASRVVIFKWSKNEHLFYISSLDDAMFYAITGTDQRYADGRAGGSIVGRGHTGPPLGHGEITSISEGGG